jgi:hypothetical protein
MKGVALLALAVTGCAAPQNYAVDQLRGPPIPLTQAEPVVRSYLARTLKDSDSVKNFAIEGPIEISWGRGLVYGGGRDQGWLFCVEYNAKNSYGAYVGLQRYPFVMRRDASGNPWIIPDVNWAAAAPGC